MNTVEKSKKIQEFLGYREGNTNKTYGYSLAKYLKWFDKKHPKTDFDSYLKDIRLMEIKDKIKTTDAYEHDLNDYLMYLKKGYSPNSVTMDMAVIKSLLRYHRIDLDNAFWDQLKRLSPSPSAKNDVIVSTQKELKEILTHANTREKAMFMTLITSGMRVGELCSLKITDIDLNHTCPRIIIRDPKNKNNGRTRISPEAKSCIKEWLKIREREIIKSYKRQINFKKVPKVKDYSDMIAKEDRLFPYETITVNRLWNKLLDASGYNELNDVSLGHTTARTHKRNVHTLRKVFRTQFGQSNDNLAEFFMNHVSQLKRTYDHKTEEWLDQEYYKALKYLSVFEVPMEESERIKALQKEMNDMKKKWDEYEKSLSDIADDADSLMPELKMRKRLRLPVSKKE